MDDLKVAELFQDAVFITANATGLGVTTLTPTCTFIKISDGTRVAGTVSEVGFGWYRVTDFINDAAGTWTTEWAVVGAYTIHGKVKVFKVGGGVIDDLRHVAAHDALIFPDDTNKTCTVTSGVGANTFGAWATLVDSAAGTLSSMFAANDGHLSAIHIEDADQVDVVYIIEFRDAISGDILGRMRFIKGTNKADVDDIRVNAPHINAGADIEYRMKDSVGGGQAELQLRYYLV